MNTLRKKEILLIAGFYFVFSVVYRLVLWYNTGGYERDGLWGWAIPKDYWFMSGMPYLFYFLTSLLIWFLGIRLLAKKSIKVKALAVVLLITVVIYLVREVRYSILDYYDIWHLKDKGAIWDWYIPWLLLLIQFGGLFAYNYHIENEKKIKLEGELRTAALKSELSALKAQLNPHFLYNVFNTISASVPSKNERTRRMIAELSDLFRYQLKASQVETVPLHEELEFINKYLELEKERFEDRLKIQFDIDEDILDEPIPPMLLQPLVENSIKHGLSSLIEGGSVFVKIKRKEKKLSFEISDTGVGVKDKEAVFNKGIGLTNTKLRLEKLYQSTLRLSDNNPRGLKISFEI